MLEEICEGNIGMTRRKSDRMTETKTMDKDNKKVRVRSSTYITIQNINRILIINGVDGLNFVYFYVFYITSRACVTKMRFLLPKTNTD